MRWTAIVVIAAVTLLSGCVTNSTVTFNSEPDGAEVYLDGKPIGTTPTTIRLSNGFWEDPTVRVQTEGYHPYIGSLDKEVKIVNGAFGLFLWWPSLLWVYGPNEDQYFYLREK